MPKKPTREAANHLRAWRIARGHTQESLAEKVGTAGNVIGLLENGGRKLSPDWLKRLADVLETTPGRILDGPPGGPDDDALVAAARAVPKESREQALAILETFSRTG